jgi:transposase
MAGIEDTNTGLDPLAAEARAGWPPAGWVTGDEAARMLGVSIETFKSGSWRWRERLRRCGTCALRPDGRRPSIYPVAEIEGIREARAAEEVEREIKRRGPFPPPGFVDRYGAAALLEIGTSTLTVWVREGRLGYAGMLATGRNGVQCRIYAVAELERAREAMRAADAAGAVLPEGFVDYDGAARFFGVHLVTVTKWQREGRLTRGRWLDLPGGKRRKVFAVAELERARERMKVEALRPVAPEGFVELHEAARLLGVHVHTLSVWERHGRVSEGRVAPIPGTSARTKVYPVEEIERLREEIRKATSEFPPAGWVEMAEAARRAHVSVEVWKRWLAEGRVENWRWASRPTKARCKLFSVEEIERLVAERGRDHLFFLEADGAGGWCPPAGYVGRGEAAKIFGVTESTFVHWQSNGWITCGRWARAPVGVAGVNGRRAYPVEELRRMVEAFEKVSQPYADPQDAGVVRVPIMSWGPTPIEAVIDAADLPRIAGMRWHWVLSYGGGESEAVRCGPPGDQVPFRRFLLGLEGPRWRINHRNGDRLDCRRANLVVRTMDEVIHGQRKRRKTHLGRAPTSRFKGVCWAEKRGKWLAHIQKDGVGRRLGAFADEIAAAEAYDEAARELFGEHARLNFPDGIDARLEGEAKLLREGGGTAYPAPVAGRPGQVRAA